MFVSELKFQSWRFIDIWLWTSDFIPLIFISLSVKQLTIAHTPTGMSWKIKQRAQVKYTSHGTTPKTLLINILSEHEFQVGCTHLKYSGYWPKIIRVWAAQRNVSSLEATEEAESADRMQFNVDLELWAGKSCGQSKHLQIGMRYFEKQHLNHHKCGRRVDSMSREAPMEGFSLFFLIQFEIAFKVRPFCGGSGRCDGRGSEPAAAGFENGGRRTQAKECSGLWKPGAPLADSPQENPSSVAPLKKFCPRPGWARRQIVP